jgi:uncharacterized protein
MPAEIVGVAALYVAPALLLLALLSAGRYPGERVLERARRRRSPRRDDAHQRRRRPPILRERSPMGHKQLMLALTLGALAVPASAQAHVSLHPNTLPSGSGPTIDVRVPNETSNARTVKVDMKIPPGFTLVSPEPVAGWTALVRTAKLAKPVKTDDGTVTVQPTEVIWTAATGKGTPAGEFQSFPLLIVVPGKDGDVLAFKTIQAYSNGSTVRWIDAPDGDHPAPTVNVTGEGGFVQEQAGDAGPPAPGSSGDAAADQTTTTPVTVTKTVTQSSTGASKGLGIAALVIAILGLLAGLAALATRRRAAA